MRIIAIAPLLAALLNCPASWSQDAVPGDYRKLTCPQLAQEGRAISKRGFALSGLEAGLGGVDGTKNSPETVMVWPSTVPAPERKRSEPLAAALKQMEAVELASIASQCSIRFQRPPGS